MIQLQINTHQVNHPAHPQSPRSSTDTLISASKYTRKPTKLTRIRSITSLIHRHINRELQSARRHTIPRNTRRSHPGSAGNPDIYYPGPGSRATKIKQYWHGTGPNSGHRKPGPGHSTNGLHGAVCYDASLFRESSGHGVCGNA